MKVITLGCDELYPWFMVSDDGYGIEKEVSEEALERWEKASEEFFKCQEEMSELYGPID